MLLKEFDQASTLLQPGRIDILTHTELSQYFIQSWSLTFYNRSDGNCLPMTFFELKL